MKTKSEENDTIAECAKFVGLADGVKTGTSERRMEVNGTYINIKSVFSGNVPLENALATIAKRKLTELKKAVNN